MDRVDGFNEIDEIDPRFSRIAIPTHPRAFASGFSSRRGNVSLRIMFNNVQ